MIPSGKNPQFSAANSPHSPNCNLPGKSPKFHTDINDGHHFTLCRFSVSGPGLKGTEPESAASADNIPSVTGLLRLADSGHSRPSTGARLCTTNPRVTLPPLEHSTSQIVWNIRNTHTAPNIVPLFFVVIKLENIFGHCLSLCVIYPFMKPGLRDWSKRYKSTISVQFAVPQCKW